MKFLTLLLIVASWLALPARAQLRLCEQIYGNSIGSNFSSWFSYPSITHNGIAIAGVSRDKTTSIHRRFLLRTGQNCDTIWSRMPFLTDSPTGDALTATDRNFVISGYDLVMSSPEHSLEKFSPSGGLLWRKKYILPVNASAAKFIQLPDSSFFMLGFDNAFQQQFFLLRTDKLGNQTGIKKRNVPLSGSSSPRDLLRTKEGNILVYGTSYQTGWIYKLNINGDSLGFSEINISSRADAITGSNEIITTSDSGFVAIVTSIQPTGSSNNPDSVSYQNVVKLDKNLNIVWRYKHPVISGYDLDFSGVTELADKSVLIMSSGLSVNANANYQLLRFSKTGQLIQTLPFTSNMCQRVHLNEGVYMGDSTVYAVGWCYRNNNINTDAYVARLSIGQVTTGMKDEILKETLLSAYPNPAKNEVVIPYNLPKSYRQASIIIREISTGREIRKYELKRSKSSLNVDVSSFSNGLYLYSLVVDEKPIATRKLAVMK